MVLKAMRTMRVVFGMLLLVGLGAGSAWGAVRYVDPKSPKPAAPYATPETAAHDIQTAIDAAEKGDTVQVAAGTYKIEKTITVRKAITLQGAGADKTTIDAQGKCRVVSLGGATIIGFTITGGGKAREGGGIACGGGSKVLKCTVTKNVAERRGGGIHARGGGKSGPCLIEDCIISENRVTRWMHTDTPWGAGGVFADQAVTARNCRIEKNIAPQRAGGIWLHGGAAGAERCIITGNQAQGKRARNSNGPGSMEEGGGGAYCDFGGRLQDCLIYGNRANKIGGGAVLSTNGRALNCTITGNSAGLRGGGVLTMGPGHVRSSIVVGNTRGPQDAGQPDDVTASHYYHVDIHQLMLGKGNAVNSCLGKTHLYYTRQRFYLGPTAGYDPKWYKNTLNTANSIAEDPKFVDPAKHDYRLQPGSPCIDGGAMKVGENAKDLDGKPRVHGKAVDMGAYERQ